MRIVLAALGAAFLGACASDGHEDFSGEASRVAGQEAQQRCAAEGKRAQLRNTARNLDGSRSYEYVCVQ
jgi:hypothetical protein